MCCFIAVRIMRVLGIVSVNIKSALLLRRGQTSWSICKSEFKVSLRCNIWPAQRGRVHNWCNSQHVRKHTERIWFVTPIFVVYSQQCNSCDGKDQKKNATRDLIHPSTREVDGLFYVILVFSLLTVRVEYE